MDYQEIINKTYRFVDSFKETKEYKELIELKEKIDILLKDKIDKFKDLNEKYTEALKYGNYHPDLKEIQIELSKAKTNLFNDDLVKKYKLLEKQLENNLNSVVTDICKSVSHKISNSNIMAKLTKSEEKI